jgi:hypothetical protein
VNLDKLEFGEEAVMKIEVLLTRMFVRQLRD